MFPGYRLCFSFHSYIVKYILQCAWSREITIAPRNFNCGLKSHNLLLTKHTFSCGKIIQIEQPNGKYTDNHNSFFVFFSSNIVVLFLVWLWNVTYLRLTLSSSIQLMLTCESERYAKFTGLPTAPQYLSVSCWTHLLRLVLVTSSVLVCFLIICHAHTHTHINPPPHTHIQQPFSDVLLAITFSVSLFPRISIVYTLWLATH